jgi:general secretion pathway protein D
MTMSQHHHTRWRIACLGIALSLLLGACAEPLALQEADQLSRTGQYESAVVRLQSALRAQPEDRKLRLALIRQQDQAINGLSNEAAVARNAGRLDDLKQVLARMEQVSPQHPRTLALRAEIRRRLRHAGLLADAQRAMEAKTYERAEATLRELLAEDSGLQKARAMLNDIDELRAAQTRNQATQLLGMGTKPITLEFREAPLKSVFEALARAASLNFVFDKDVRGEAKATVFLRNIAVDEALRVILSTQQLSYKLLNENTVLVFPATQQKQRDVLDTVTKTYYLTNTDPKQAQSLVRTVAKTRDIFIDERLNLMVVRDTPEVVRLIDRLMQNLDVAEAEVVMDVEVMEVSSTKVNAIGLNLPEVFNYGVPGASGSGVITSATSGLRWYTADPGAVATLKGSAGLSNLLANPSIRARNREKAKILLGEKLPVFTSTSTANVGTSASVNYLDVGLKLEVEPQVQLDNDVTIKVALEVSSVTKEVDGPSNTGSKAYQIGTRQASTTLRIRDGETQVLAGLINDNETRNSAGVPGLHDLPIAGRLFGTTTDTHDKTEVILLITPHIVRSVAPPSTAAAMVPSGTDAQPGAAAMTLRPGVKAMKPTSGSSIGGGAGGPPRDTSGRGVGDVQGGPQLGVSGPEEVMAGASFQVVVTNPSAQPLATSLSVDPSVLNIETAGGQGGRIGITVPPRGSLPVMLRAKADVRMADTAITIDAGGVPLSLRVRDPNTPDPTDNGNADGAVPAPEPAPAVSGEPNAQQPEFTFH